MSALLQVYLPPRLRNIFSSNPLALIALSTPTSSIDFDGTLPPLLQSRNRIWINNKSTNSYKRRERNKMVNFSVVNERNMWLIQHCQTHARKNVFPAAMEPTTFQLVVRMLYYWATGDSRKLAHMLSIDIHILTVCRTLVTWNYSSNKKRAECIVVFVLCWRNPPNFPFMSKIMLNMYIITSFFYYFYYCFSQWMSQDLRMRTLVMLAAYIEAARSSRNNSQDRLRKQ